MKYWIWLSGCLGFGSNKFKPLIEKFKTPAEIYNADISALASEYELSVSQIKRLKNKSLAKAEEIYRVCIVSGINILTYCDDSYPTALKNIDNPPICLYYKGDLPDFNNIPVLSIVGSRNADDYSCKAAWSLAARLSLSNCLVVSGGAVGIDSWSHKGCLDAGYKTVAVLACGINYPYLKSNINLRKTISENGCLISEFPPDFPVIKTAFHIRNRIISGLSQGTVIIAASKHSGALLTAKYAAEQGRDVFVVTGKPNDKNYGGSNDLIRDGAKPVFDFTDIVLEYQTEYGNIIDFERPHSLNLSQLYRSIYQNNLPTKETKIDSKKVSQKIVEKNINETLSKNAQIVYNYINTDNFSVDDLIETGLSVSDIFSAVTELEITGFVSAVPGGRYSKLN